ncbi:MAG: adenine deaminase C-terminal domain-containing protein [Syntrophobacteraceae bacterium]|nr:adenine deaminase C-terminal domain-containing protein [Syntrophobacteraceae bacterium]
MGNQAFQKLMCNADQRAALMRVASGVEPADAVILNGSVVNVYTGEIMDNCPVAIKGKWIASVGADSASAVGESTLVLDASGKTLSPGLIDGHTHVWFFTLGAFLPYAIKGGVTTIITETMEFLPMGGYEGVTEFLDSAGEQPIKVLGTAPALISTSKAQSNFSLENLEKLLDRDDIVGLGESFWQAVLQAPEAMAPRFQAALDRGKRLEGHSAGARGKKLAAYAATGISSCHEPITAEEALERLRLGIYVMVREGSIRKDLESISRIRHAGVDLRRLILATDSIEPTELVEKGYLEVVVQKAIDCGFDPVAAIQMASLNVAEHFGLDSVIGGIAPGRRADILVIPDAKTIAPEVVISDGRIIYKDREFLAAPRKHRYSDSSRRSMKLPRPVTASDFDICAAAGSKGPVTVRVIDMVSDLVSKESHVEVFPVEGKIRIDPGRDIIKISAIDYCHNPGRSFTGLIKGFGIKKGAIACSAAWDSTNIIVAGAGEEDMAQAAERVREMGGGAVVCKDGHIAAELPLPIFAVLSDLDMEPLARRVKSVRRAARDLGMPFCDPLLSLCIQTSAAIPYLKICEEGLVNLKDGKTYPLEVR